MERLGMNYVFLTNLDFNERTIHTIKVYRNSTIKNALQSSSSHSTQTENNIPHFIQVIYVRKGGEMVINKAHALSHLTKDQQISVPYVLYVSA